MTPAPTAQKELAELLQRLDAKTKRCKELENLHQNFCHFINRVVELERELATREIAIRNEEHNKILRLIESDEWQKEHDEEIRNATLTKLIEDVCKQCPIRNEEMPLEDYSAETCEGCLIRKVVQESLRTKEQP